MKKAQAHFSVFRTKHALSLGCTVLILSDYNEKQQNRYFSLISFYRILFGNIFAHNYFQTVRYPPHSSTTRSAQPMLHSLMLSEMFLLLLRLFLHFTQVECIGHATCLSEVLFRLKNASLYEIFFFFTQF